MAEQHTKGEMPRYRLTEKAYIEDVLYDPESQNPAFHEVDYAGIPGHHMIPVNAAAKAMKETAEGKKAAKFLDPILQMTNVTAASA